MSATTSSTASTSASSSTSESSESAPPSAPVSPKSPEPAANKIKTLFPAQLRAVCEALEGHQPDWRLAKLILPDGAVTVERYSRPYTSFAGLKGVVLKMIIEIAGTVTNKPHEFRLTGGKKGAEFKISYGAANVLETSAVGDARTAFDTYAVLMKQFAETCRTATAADFKSKFDIKPFGKQVAKKPKSPGDTEDLAKELAAAKHLKEDSFINDSESGSELGSEDSISNSSDDSDSTFSSEEGSDSDSSSSGSSSGSSSSSGSESSESEEDAKSVKRKMSELLRKAAELEKKLRGKKRHHKSSKKEKKSSKKHRKH